MPSQGARAGVPGMEKKGQLAQRYVRNRARRNFAFAVHYYAGDKPAETRNLAAAAVNWGRGDLLAALIQHDAGGAGAGVDATKPTDGREVWGMDC